MTETVRVDLGERSYDILIGPDLLRGAGDLIGPLLPRPRTVVVTEARVADLHWPALQTGLAAAGVEAEAIVLPPGEGTKSMTQLAALCDALLARQVERDDLIVALGGGVVGDLAGFAAAVLRRGVGFVQIPTSLLAQVDSSVGGKTGVNAAAGKNLIGAFHQPRLVLCDTDLLRTLPSRDFLAGYGEVMKYGLLGDADFFAWLEENAPALVRHDPHAVVHAVKRSCEMKAEIVARDETEKGDRALLNLGHTFGHALEAATGYSDRLLHGEGVAIGCSLAFEASARLGLCSQEAPSRVRQHLDQMGMKKDLSDIPGSLPDAAGLMSLMAQDKKVRQGRIAFILAREVGNTFVSRDADLYEVQALIEERLSQRG